jgi:hypothetical protein
MMPNGLAPNGTNADQNMKIETAIETARAVLAKSSTCAGIKMVQEHADYPARSTAWVGKFQRTKGERMQRMETATDRAIPAERAR